MQETMKKSIIPIIAIATMALVSCNKENVPEQGRTITFTAVSETMDSKAGLATDGKSLQWTIGDKVTLFFQKTGEAGKAVIAEASVTSVATNGTATFTATVPETADMSEVVASYNDNSSASETDLHPFYTQTDAAYTRHRVTVSKTQAAVKGGYDPATTPLVGFWKGNAGDPIAMTFKNVTALLCIDLTNSSSKTIESITLSNSAYNIAGCYYYLTPSRDGFSWKASKDTSKDITLTGTITNGKYYFALIGEKQTLPGITLTFTASDGKTAVFRNSNNLSVERNNIYNIGTFTITDASFESKPQGIVFSDTKVNMDDTFYAALANSCTATTTAGKYTLSATVEKDFIKITPKNSGICDVYYDYSGKNYISNKHMVAFTSGSAGNALLVLYCAIYKQKDITLTWKDSKGNTKTVPEAVVNALKNPTGSTIYYDGSPTNQPPISLSLPGVEVGDVFTFALSTTTGHRFYNFYWKEDTSTKSAFGAAGDAGQTGSSETYPNTL